ncbi:alpha/beta fold hydrolase [uncultured Jatrophihabitans sp.]|uniref:alpha/beta fold hydrolase n=1 Tax=uncultured Jatrophihabitans sp. TaxID=1610747 RepID=UPI0035C9793D
MTAQLSTGSARRTTFELVDQRIAALQTGDESAPPVLLVAGYTGSKEDFGPVLDPLAEAGYFVTAIDLPGQYESPGLPAAADYTPDRLAVAVLGVAAALGADVRLLGHSFGGLVSRAAVIAQPDRFGSLTLLCSGPAHLGGTRRLSMDTLEPVLAASGLPGVYAAMQSAALGDPAFVAPPDDLADFLERRFLGGSPQMLQGMADALRTEPDRVDDLAATGVPVLVTHGVDDDAWPIDAQADMAQRLGARYAPIRDAAHSPAIENPTGLATTLVGFWQS